MKKISEKVFDRRRKLGVTQSEISRKTGLRQASISDFETGKRSIGSKSLDMIFEILDLKVKAK